jgi:hypothetical protein
VVADVPDRLDHQLGLLDEDVVAEPDLAHRAAATDEINDGLDHVLVAEKGQPAR